jgi:hypothetical protein
MPLQIIAKGVSLTNPQGIIFYASVFELDLDQSPITIDRNSEIIDRNLLSAASRIPLPTSGVLVDICFKGESRYFRLPLACITDDGGLCLGDLTNQQDFLDYLREVLELESQEDSDDGYTTEDTEPSSPVSTLAAASLFAQGRQGSIVPPQSSLPPQQDEDRHFVVPLRRSNAGIGPVSS